MSDVFISYARSTEAEARKVAGALQAMGYGVWRDDELPAHRAYSDVIEERLRAARAVIVVWSAEAVRSHWVRAEAEVAREAGTLVQLSIDGVTPPLPFNQIQCADMSGWVGDQNAPGWKKVVASVADLAGVPTKTQATEPAPAERGAASPHDKPSIAVMPFSNLSGDPEQEYFADGMVVEIAEVLSRFRSIFVTASASTLALKGRGVAPADVGRQLGVRYVLEGTVRKAGGRVRIGVQLVDCSGGAPLWTERFEGSLTDVFALQDEVAQRVASSIAPEVEQAELRRARVRPTESLSAYDLYLRGMAEIRADNGSRTCIEEALSLMERALAIDPDFGPAMLGAAVCHQLICWNRWSDDSESNVRQALSLARRAVAVAGDDAEVLGRAATLISGFGEPDAQGLVDRAWALNPASTNVLMARAYALLHRGDPEACLEMLDAVARAQPGRPNDLERLRAIALFHLRRFPEAAALYRARVVAPGGGSALNYAYLAACYGHMGEAALAREALANVQARMTDAIDTLTATDALGLGYRFAGPRAVYDEGIALAVAMTDDG